MTPVIDTNAIHEYILETHRDTLRAVNVSADAVAEQWPNETTTHRDCIILPLRDEFARRNLNNRLLTVLEHALQFANVTPPAQLIPAPPYVNITSLGPVLRATIPPGRLVISLQCFTVNNTPDTRYRKTRFDLATTLHVKFVKNTRSP